MPNVPPTSCGYTDLVSALLVTTLSTPPERASGGHDSRQPPHAWRERPRQERERQQDGCAKCELLIAEAPGEQADAASLNRHNQHADVRQQIARLLRAQAQPFVHEEREDRLEDRERQAVEQAYDQERSNTWASQCLKQRPGREVRAWAVGLFNTLFWRQRLRQPDQHTQQVERGVKGNQSDLRIENMTGCLPVID